MEKENIDINVIKDYLNHENNKLRLKSFLRLYSNYSKLAKFNKEELKSFENEIYNIDGKTLSDKEKIRKEIVTIKVELKKNNNKEITNYVNNILADVELIINYDDATFNGYISYLKKCICEIQSVLNLDINFYSSSCELFREEYQDIENVEHKVNIKKEQ